MYIDPLHKWRLNLINNTYASLASYSCKTSFALKHDYEAKDVSSVVIQIYSVGVIYTKQGLYNV